MTLGFSYAHIRRLSKNDFSPVIFNRKTQTLSIFYKDELVEKPWSEVTATIKRVRSLSGHVVHTDTVLEIHNLGAKTLIDGGEGLWEFIRNYMDDGPDELYIPAMRSDTIMQRDKQEMYSFNFKESLKVHWIGAILKKKNSDILDKIFAAIFIPIKIVFFVPNVMGDWVWRRMCLRFLKDSKITLQESLKYCDNPINTTDCEHVLKDKGERGLTYKEIRRRLSKLNT